MCSPKDIGHFRVSQWEMLAGNEPSQYWQSSEADESLENVELMEALAVFFTWYKNNPKESKVLVIRLKGWDKDKSKTRRCFCDKGASEQMCGTCDQCRSLYLRSWVGLVIKVHLKKKHKRKRERERELYEIRETVNNYKVHPRNRFQANTITWHVPWER